MLVCIPSISYGEDTNTFGGVANDKILHFSLSSFMTSSSIRMGQAINDKHKVTWMNRTISSALVFTIGYYKEVYDSTQPYNKFDSEDIRANVFGIISGNLLLWEF